MPLQVLVAKFKHTLYFRLKWFTVVSFSQHFFILLTGKQCPDNKLGLFIKAKAVWKTSYVTNATMTKAWCGQKERMISCLWQQNSAQMNWILSLTHLWKKSSTETGQF